MEARNEETRALAEVVSLVSSEDRSAIVPHFTSSLFTPSSFDGSRLPRDNETRSRVRLSCFICRHSSETGYSAGNRQ